MNMGKVIAEITMSLDGFAAGPNISSKDLLGVNGQRLHDWMFKGAGESGNAIDKQVAGEFFTNVGSFIIGRLTFDLGIHEWGDDGAFGVPCFVVTNRPNATVVKGPTTFTFVTDGIESALRQAKAAAGDKDVCIMGGANAIQQYIKAGLVDELNIHIAPILLGDGRRLFDNIGSEPITLQQTRVLYSPMATHLKFHVEKGK
jgi:dihydrofolate reductase